MSILKPVGVVAQELEDYISNNTLIFDPNTSANKVTVGAVGAPGVIGPSISANPWPQIWDGPTRTIKGKMFTAEVKVYDTALQLPVLDKDAIRKKLADQIVEKLMASQFIEFTQQKIMLEDCVAIRARFYAVPDGDVQYIRQNKLDE